MLQQCLEFKALTESIEDVKDELMNLGDIDTSKEDKTGSGLDKCKVNKKLMLGRQSIT